jgi:hypothetical protein
MLDLELEQEKYQRFMLLLKKGDSGKIRYCNAAYALMDGIDISKLADAKNN